MYIYIYIYIYICIRRRPLRYMFCLPPFSGRGDDTVGNPHRAQMFQFELFELVLLLKLDEQFPVEQFEASRAEAAVSQSAVACPPLNLPPFLYHRLYQHTRFTLPPFVCFPKSQGELLV